MYRISELAAVVGLSRTTLLYYEKLGLIEGRRLSNGYRVYNEQDVQRLRLIQQLHAGGLTLKECQACLEAKIDRQILLNRLSRLDEEIAQKQQARALLSALLGESGLKAWHETIDKIAPDAHLDWLIKQGFNEKEALRLKWLSKDMNEHERYMADFMHIYEALDQWGPGLETDTLKALAKIPFSPKKIIDIGCGKGAATVTLAQHTTADIIAVDNDAPALQRLSVRIAEAGFTDRVTTACASMTHLPFDDYRADVIWSEASAYIMGVTNAFKAWQGLLEDNGVLVISDLVWLTSSPSTEVAAFWRSAYPDMVTIEERSAQAEAAGYRVLDSFTLSKAAWENYFVPLQARVETLKEELHSSAALRDIETELAIYHHYFDEFGYQMFVLQKK